MSAIASQLPKTIAPKTVERKVWTDTECMASEDGYRYAIVKEKLIDRGNSGSLAERFQMLSFSTKLR